jgi:hypothetical protein
MFPATIEFLVTPNLFLAKGRFQDISFLSTVVAGKRSPRRLVQPLLLQYLSNSAYRHL